MKVYLLPLMALASAALAPAQTTYTFETVDYPGAGYSQLNAINSSGAIVGRYSPATIGATVYSFLRSPDGSFKQLLPGTPSSVSGISDSGVIVGSVGKVGFILSNTYTPIKSPNYITFLNGISTDGSIVGAFNDGHGTSYGFETQGGNLRPLPYYNEAPVSPDGINSAGTIVGFPESTANGAVILPAGGTYQVIQYPGAVQGTNLSGINDAGVAVGFQFGSPPESYAQGFSYAGGVFADVVYPGSIGTYPYGISNSGVIVGSYFDSKGISHGFIATPAP